MWGKIWELLHCPIFSGQFHVKSLKKCGETDKMTSHLENISWNQFASSYAWYQFNRSHWSVQKRYTPEKYIVKLTI